MTSVARLHDALANRYAIEREAGRGGMATVYVARDIKHDRRVAVKVLHPDLAAALGAERFLAEIRTTANLQHPHILPLHDSGEADGFLFYVMPFVEGETLRGRLERERQLPMDDALRIAREMLSALDYAHRHGVVHRDVKPENVLLHDGSALVADFGIALAVTAAGGQRMTQTGLSLGTPQYMSPEQAMGERTIDARSDVYAVGAVFYEMLTGEPPFSGASVQAIVAKVMTERPTPPSTVRDTVPPHVEAAVLKALANLPADRFASAALFVDALGRPMDSGATTTSAARRPGAEARWRRVALVAGVVAFASLGAAALAWTRRPAPVDVERFELSTLRVLPVSGSVAVLSYTGPTLALSSDGTRIAYVSRDSAGVGRVWIRDVADLTPRPLGGTEGASSVTISPDGRSVALIAGSALVTVPVDGGSPVTLVQSNATMPHWGVDGMIYFSMAHARGRAAVARVPASGGAVDTVVVSAMNLYDPSPLPDGRGVLLSSRGFGRGQSDKVSVLTFTDGRLHELADGIRPRYVAPGYLLYVGPNRRLLAAPFDARKLELTGPAMPVVDSGAAGPGFVFQHAASANGALLYMTGARSRLELMWVSRDGTAHRVDSSQQSSGDYPRLSPDGSRVALSRNGIWVKQLDRGPEVLISSRGNYPAWTGDGRSLSYFTSDTAGFHLLLKPVDGGAQEMRLVPQMKMIVESVWSRTGGWLVLRTAAGRFTGGDIYAMRPGVDTAPMPIVSTADSEVEPALSPDGRFLAYASNQTGRYEIYVVPFPNAASARWAVSTDGGLEPAWSPRGDELFYRDVAGNVVSVSVKTTPTFTRGASTVLFSAAEYDRYEGHRQYDVAPDGRRFIMVRQVRGGERPSVVLVKGWLEAVRAKAPAPR